MPHNVDSTWEELFEGEDEQQRGDNKVEPKKSKRRGSQDWWYNLSAEKQQEIIDKRVASRAAGSAKKKATNQRKRADKPDKPDKPAPKEAQSDSEIQMMVKLLTRHIGKLTELTDMLEKKLQPILADPQDVSHKYEIYDDAKTELGMQLADLDMNIVHSTIALEEIIERNQL